MGKFYESSKDASKGGFASIKKVRGFCVDIDIVPPPDGWETDKMQVQAELKDSAILEMFEGESEFELKEGKFSCMWSYGITQEDYDENPEKKPPAGCPWVAAAVKSAEEQGKKPTDFIGSVITLERKPVKLFSHRPKKDDEGNDIEVGPDGKYPLVDVMTENYFSFAKDEGADSDDFQEYARKELSGLTARAAKRKLLRDLRLKQIPELKDRLEAGTLAEFLDMVVVDEKFVVPEE